MSERRKLSEIIDSINAAIDNSEGEITEAIAALELEFEDKAEAYAAIIAEKKLKSKSAAELKKKYAAQQERHDNSIEWLEKNLMQGMQSTGKTDIHTATAHIWIQKNERLDVDDAKFKEAYPPKLFPELYLQPKYTPSKTAIGDLVDQRKAAGFKPEEAQLSGVTEATTETLRIA